VAQGPVAESQTRMGSPPAERMDDYRGVATAPSHPLSTRVAGTASGRKPALVAFRQEAAYHTARPNAKERTNVWGL